jgi:hypothetical protein
MSAQIEAEDAESPEKLIDEICSELDEMHDRLADATMHIGYSRDALRSVRPTWEALGNAHTDDPDAAAVYWSGVQFLGALRDEVHAHKVLFEDPASFALTSSGSSSYFVSATETTASFISASTNIALPVDLPEPPFHPSRHESYAMRFSRFDTSLGRTYQEIWEAMYGTRADPERSALFLTRQAFDQFFEKLAPDDQVRQSPHWEPKGGNDANMVTRKERIEFAAATHIKDETRANTLRTSANHMLDVYKRLNTAHNRGELDQFKARSALNEMQLILESWADAIGI